MGEGMYKEEEGVYVWKGGFPNSGGLGWQDKSTRCAVMGGSVCGHETAQRTLVLESRSLSVAVTFLTPTPVGLT